MSCHTLSHSHTIYRLISNLLYSFLKTFHFFLIVHFIASTDVFIYSHLPIRSFPQLHGILQQSETNLKEPPQLRWFFYNICIEMYITPISLTGSKHLGLPDWTVPAWTVPPVAGYLRLRISPSLKPCPYLGWLTLLTLCFPQRCPGC